MIYVIGKDKLDWAKIDVKDYWYTDEKGNSAIDRVLLKVKVGVPQYKATFFNNKVDAEEMIENIKKFKPVIVAYLPTDEAPSVDELKVFTLDIVSEVE